MTNTQINITENGTTILATAGKYCDRNIDVNVDVGGKPTQFTNLYDPSCVVIDKNNSYSSSDGYVITSDTECNYIKIPYTHSTGSPALLRMRGIGTVRGRFSFELWDADGGIVTWGQIPRLSKYYDECGDVVFDLGAYTTRAWNMLEFNFQYDGYSSATEAIEGPIITINEPIGNGGYVE